MGVLSVGIPTPIKALPKVRGLVGALSARTAIRNCVGAVCRSDSDRHSRISGEPKSQYCIELSLFTLCARTLSAGIAAGTSMGAARKLIESSRITRATDMMRRVAGGVIVLVGIYFAGQAF